MVEVVQQWQRMAGRVAFRVNTARFLSSAAPALVIGGALVMVVGVASRYWVPDHAAIIVSGVSGFSLLLIAAAAFLRCRRRLIGQSEAMVRLEDVLGLNNALTAAAAGVGQWPECRHQADHRLCFNWTQTLLPVFLAAALVALGLLIPVSGAARGPVVMPPPRSHEEIAAAIAKLEEADVVKKEDVAELRRQLDEIRGESPENWYRHSSLEAADHLKAGMLNDLRGVAHNLERGHAALGALEAGAEAMTPDERQRLARDFKSALEALKSRSPGLNQKLMSALSKVDPSNLKSLNHDDLQEMLDQMKSAAGVCKNCVGGDQRGDRGSGAEAQRELKDLLEGRESARDESATGPDGEGAGRGGVQRGPGVAPLPLSKARTELATEKPEGLAAGDLSRARPGDTIGTTDVEHHLDKSPAGPRAGGAAVSDGQGGDAVWRDSLLPQEKAVLQKYFR
jgi:hypothetical protein